MLNSEIDFPRLIRDLPLLGEAVRARHRHSASARSSLDPPRVLFCEPPRLAMAAALAHAQTSSTNVVLALRDDEPPSGYARDFRDSDRFDSLELVNYAPVDDEPEPEPRNRHERRKQRAIERRRTKNRTKRR